MACFSGKRGLGAALGLGAAAWLATGYAPVQAQGLTTLYSFTGGADGASLYKGPTLDSAGNLYGSAFYGANACPDSFQYAGVGCGTIWKLSPSGTLTVLATFTGAANGADPDGNLTLKKGMLYGTAYVGGSGGQGTVFKLSTSGTKFKTLYSFSGSDGANPDSYPRLDKQGNIFGVVPYGGPAWNGTSQSGFGVLFEIAAGGGFVSQHPFSGGADGGVPGRIFLNAAGTIFGSTGSGGACSGSGLPAAGCGTVYEFVPSTGQFTTLYTFTGLNDGYVPSLAGVDSFGNIYGATGNGGANGYGTLFKLKPKKAGGYAYVHLYDFSGNADGAYPNSPLLAGPDEMIGGTERGPIVGNNTGAGVLFEYNKGTFSTLYTFVNDSHGGYPFGTPVLGSTGTIYGTTAYGGVSPCSTTGGTVISSYGCGTVYQYVP